MALTRARERVPAKSQRRPAPAARTRAPATRSQQLQQRAGNKAAATLIARSVQPSAAAPAAVSGGLKISSPHDAAEREATTRASQVMRMRDSGTVSVSSPGSALQLRPADSPPAAAGQRATLPASPGGGEPLPRSVRAFMEPRFGANFSNVRIHTDAHAAQLSSAINARAFTTGQHIYFADNAFQPDSPLGRELIAHELTHTIQQGATVQRSAGPQIHERSALQIQRWNPLDWVAEHLPNPLDWLAERAYVIPGFRMFTIVLGVNPLNMSAVDRSAANVLRAVVEFMPGGALITRALDNYGVFERAGQLVSDALSRLGMSARGIRDAIDRFIDSLSLRELITHPGAVWSRAVSIFSDPIERVIDTVVDLAVEVLHVIRDAILRPLAGLAEGTRGWDLLCAVLGQNPITGEPVAQTAAALIGGFMRLIGQEEVWENIQRGNAVGRAWSWFRGALQTVLGFVRRLPGLFVQALESLEIADLVLLPRAFSRVVGVFANFAGEFVSWAGEAVWNLLEIIFSVVAPAVMVYLRRARTAFRTILRNPIGFLRNLIAAARLGLNQFVANFLTHLRASLVGWLTGTLEGAGVYIPTAFTLSELVKFVLSVLGLTWQNIRQKLVRAIGEPAVRALETGFDIVVTLVREGPAAAWQRIVESLTNLRDMVIEQVLTFVRDRIVTAAVTRLLSLLSPVGAFIQAIIGIYNTIMFFVERMRQIAQVAAAVIDSISAIASGVITQAANSVEQTMARLLTVVVSFLARIAGLGNVSQAITNIINRIRQPIDRALDRVVEWIVSTARRLGRLVAQAGVPQDPNERLRLATRAAVQAVDRYAGRPVGRVVLTPLLAAIQTRYGLRVLELTIRDNRWAVHAQINPEAIAFTRAIVLRDGASERTVLIIELPKILVFEFRRFTANQNVSVNEMTEGLTHHQNALNALTVDRWLANIHFRPFLRGAVAAEERDIARRDLIRQLRSEIVTEYRGRGVSLSPQELNRLVAVRARGRHASHSADFIAGGNIDAFDGLERGAVNSYVGSNWGRFRPELEAYATHLRQLFEPRDRPRVNMNFRLRIRFLN